MSWEHAHAGLPDSVDPNLSVSTKLAELEIARIEGRLATDESDSENLSIEIQGHDCFFCN